MVLTFQSWMNLSTDFPGAPGSGVAAVPWGNHFALYATDNTGKVRCAGCYLQTGLMGPWALFTNDFAGYNSVPAPADAAPVNWPPVGSRWLPLFWPPTLVPVT